MKSKLTHSDVISIELSVREGLYHNRSIITVTEQNKTYDRDIYPYYYEPIKVNTYRIAGKLVLRSIAFDKKLEEVFGKETIEQLIEEAKRIQRLQLPLVKKDNEERYPDIELTLDFRDEEVKIDIFVKYPSD